MRAIFDCASMFESRVQDTDALSSDAQQYQSFNKYFNDWYNIQLQLARQQTQNAQFPSIIVQSDFDKIIKDIRILQKKLDYMEKNQSLMNLVQVRSAAIVTKSDLSGFMKALSKISATQKIIENYNNELRNFQSFAKPLIQQELASILEKLELNTKRNWDTIQSEALSLDLQRFLV